MNGGSKRKGFFKKFIEGERVRKDSARDARTDGSSTERNIVKKSDDDICEKYSFFGDNINKGEETVNENNTEARSEQRERISTDLWKLICGTVTTVVVIAAVGVTAFAWFTAKSSPTKNTAPDTDIYAGISEDDKKIIFVREFDSESGILSPSEIYEQCKDSVVTVMSGNKTSVGSGFVFSDDGYIATAAHVVEGIDQLQIVTSGGNIYAAEIVHMDEGADVALLRTNARNLQSVSFGESGKMLVGESVYAIGTPAAIDYSGSFCSGEITYMDRTISVYDSMGRLEKKMTVIQTNAILNPGNSGCPLFDGYGRVVGMVTMKLGGDYDGIGFALPSDGVKAVLDAMKNGDSIDNDILSGIVTLSPKLGIYGETSEVDGIFGYLINSFTECGSDAPAILKKGDLIIAINGNAVSRGEDITAEINKRASGDTIRVTVVRSGQNLTFDVTLGG